MTPTQKNIAERLLPARFDMKTFAQAHRLRPRRDEDGTLIVPGRVGQLYDHDGGRLAAMVLNGTPRLWGSRRRPRRRHGAVPGLRGRGRAAL